MAFRGSGKGRILPEMARADRRGRLPVKGPSNGPRARGASNETPPGARWGVVGLVDLGIGLRQEDAGGGAWGGRPSRPRPTPRGARRQSSSRGSPTGGWRPSRWMNKVYNHRQRKRNSARPRPRPARRTSARCSGQVADEAPETRRMDPGATRRASNDARRVERGIGEDGGRAGRLGRLAPKLRLEVLGSNLSASFGNLGRGRVHARMITRTRDEIRGEIWTPVHSPNCLARPPGIVVVYGKPEAGGEEQEVRRRSPSARPGRAGPSGPGDSPARPGSRHRTAARALTTPRSLPSVAGRFARRRRRSGGRSLGWPWRSGRPRWPRPRPRAGSRRRSVRSPA